MHFERPAVRMESSKTLYFTTAMLVCYFFMGSDTAIPRKYPEGSLLQIDLPDVIRDFEYVPIKEGYIFSYELIDGTKREEVGDIPGAPEKSTGYSQPRDMPPKKRKLSPTALKSAAG